MHRDWNILAIQLQPDPFHSTASVDRDVVLQLLREHERRGGKVAQAKRLARRAEFALRETLLAQLLLAGGARKRRSGRLEMYRETTAEQPLADRHMHANSVAPMNPGERGLVRMGTAPARTSAIGIESGSSSGHPCFLRRADGCPKLPLSETASCGWLPAHLFCWVSKTQNRTRTEIGPPNPSSCFQMPPGEAQGGWEVCRQ